MKPQSAILSPVRILAFTAICVAVYLAWVGPERFYYEALGTWILSPLIYIRILPVPLSYWLLSALHHHHALSLVLYGAPVFLLVVALSAAIVSLHRRSLTSAFAALGLTALVFGTYHVLQPMGITLVEEGDAPQYVAD